jgi:tetratricopeptide (TPR) repeat protein
MPSLTWVGYIIIGASPVATLFKPITKELIPESLLRDGVESLTKPTANNLLHQLRVALRAAKKNSDQNGIAWILLRISMIFRGQRQYESAIQLLDDSRAIFKGLNNDLGLASVYMELSIANRELERNTLALDYGHKALKRLEKQGKSLELAWAYDNLSVVYFNLSRRHESLVYAKKARTLFQDYNSRNGLAWNATNLANLYFDMAFYDKAIRYYREALLGFERLHNRQGQAWSLLGLGMVHRSISKLSEAQTLIQKAKYIYRELGLKDREAWCLLNEASIKRVIGKDEDALLLNKRSIQLFSPQRVHDGVAWALFQGAQIFRDRGNAIKAWQTFREALHLHTDISNKKGMAWAENELGDTYVELSDISHARECFVRAKVIADRLDDTGLLIDIDANLAKLFLVEGRLQKAHTMLEKVEIGCRKIQSRETETEVLLQRARYNIIIGDLPKAKSLIRQAGTLIESYGLQRLRPAWGIYWGEIHAGEGKFEAAIKIWHDVLQQAKKACLRPIQSTALLGIAQVLSSVGFYDEVRTVIHKLEKDSRHINSRHLKAKILFVKALVTYRQLGRLDVRHLSAPLRILQSSNLTVLEHQVLDILIHLYSKIGKKYEWEESTRRDKELLDQGPADLHLVASRRTLFTALPISLVV